MIEGWRLRRSANPKKTEHGYLLKVDEVREKFHTPNLWDGVGLMSFHDGLHNLSPNVPKVCVCFKVSPIIPKKVN